MTSRSSLSVYRAFFVRAIFIASAIMFACMALGEICYDKNLFSGFLSKPILWAGVFLETTLATVFMTSLGALFLYRFRFLNKKSFALTSIAIWLLLGILVIALYNHFYWTREWHMTEMAPGLVFGWIVPGLLSVFSFIGLSFGLRIKDGPCE